ILKDDLGGMKRREVDQAIKDLELDHPAAKALKRAMDSMNAAMAGAVGGAAGAGSWDPLGRRPGLSPPRLGAARRGWGAPGGGPSAARRAPGAEPPWGGAPGSAPRGSVPQGAGGARGGRGRPRILGPRVLRVPAAHLLAHLLVRAVPEGAQIVGDREGPTGRR